jgi:hypothetical protein
VVSGPLEAATRDGILVTAPAAAAGVTKAQLASPVPSWCATGCEVLRFTSTDYLTPGPWPARYRAALPRAYGRVNDGCRPGRSQP